MSSRAQQNSLAASFRSLHIKGKPLLLTNVYDAPTASFVANHPSTKAVATASYAIAACQGIDDNALTLSQNLTAVRSIAATVDASRSLPLTVDIQDGYEDVTHTIQEIIKVGAVGCNLEDLTNTTGQLRPLPEAVHRIELALQAAKDMGVPDFVINARTDALIVGETIEEAIKRGKAYLNAGACTVFVWGGAARGVSREEVTELVEAFDGRLNVKLVPREGYLTVPDLAKIGVARISMGPELWRAAMAAVKAQAEAVLKSWTENEVNI